MANSPQLETIQQMTVLENVESKHIPFRVRYTPRNSVPSMTRRLESWEIGQKVVNIPLVGIPRFRDSGILRPLARHWMPVSSVDLGLYPELLVRRL